MFTERRNEQCKLYCRVQGTSNYFMLKDKVIDGTKCSIDSFDICINGRCVVAGCDNRMGSNAKLGEIVTITGDRDD